MTRVEILKDLLALIKNDPEYKPLVATIKKYNPQIDAGGLRWLNNLFEYNGKAGPILSVDYPIEVNRAIVKRVLFYMASMAIISDTLAKLLPAAPQRSINAGGTIFEITKITYNDMLNEVASSRSEVTTTYTIGARCGQTDLVFADARLSMCAGLAAEGLADASVNYDPAIFIRLSMALGSTKKKLRAMTVDALTSLDKQSIIEVFFDLVKDCLQDLN